MNTKEMQEPLLEGQREEAPPQPKEEKRFHQQEQLPQVYERVEIKARGAHCCEKTCIFGGEIIFLVGLVSSTAIFISALALPYFIMGIILFNQIHNYEWTVLNRKHAILIVSAIYSLLVFVVKLILSFLVLLKIVFPSPLLFQTLGI